MKASADPPGEMPLLSSASTGGSVGSKLGTWKWKASSGPSTGGIGVSSGRQAGL